MDNASEMIQVKILLDIYSGCGILGVMEPLIIVVLQIMWLLAIAAMFIVCIAAALGKPRRILPLYAMMMGVMFGIRFSDFLRLFGLLP